MAKQAVACASGLLFTAGHGQPGAALCRARKIAAKTRLGVIDSFGRFAYFQLR
jgi:hypothetical protein